MSTLISKTSGNFTAAGTWGVADATSLLDSEANNTALTTSFVSSSTFVTGVITIDSIAVRIFSRAASPSGTLSIRLFNVTLAAAVAGTTVTINISDVNATPGGGWYVFKFAAPVLLVAATTYAVQATTSVAAQINLNRDATAANWSRLLRTTTTAAPAASDVLVVAGDFTAAGAFSSYTVTNDNTATTTFGKLGINDKGTFSSGVAAATNYYLKLGGDLIVRSAGILNIGTSGTPIPASSTASLEFACTVNVEFGLIISPGATVNAYGNPITVSALLAADAAAAATSLTTNVSTGWLSGDQIAIASTTRTAAESELKSLTANAVTTTLTIAAIGNAHSGTSPTQGELINLTRNVKIFGTSTTFNAYIIFNTTAIVAIDSVEIYQMGSATAGKRGIDLQTTTGTCLINKCSIHDFIVTSAFGILITGAASNNFTISNNVFWNTNNAAISIALTTGTAYSISNNIAIDNIVGSLFTLNDLGGTITGNTSVSATTTGFSLSDATFNGTFSGNIAHSNTTIGFSIANVTSGNLAPGANMATITSWRNNTYGLTLANCFGFMFDTMTLFGNLTAGMNISTHNGGITFKAIMADAGVTLLSPIGIAINADSSDMIFDSCLFGSNQTHATADVSIPLSNTYVTNMTFKNCLFSSVNEIINTNSNMNNGGYIGSQKHDQVANNHKNFKRAGITTIDTTIFNSSSPSSRMTPNSATIKLEDSTKKVAVNSGQTVTPSVYVRKSSAGDGTAYTGNQPRLIVKANSAIGITSDTVLDTMVVATGTWEQLSGTTIAATDNGVMEFVVDCDGAAGWVNADDWSAS